MEESRVRGLKETERKIAEGENQVLELGKELRYAHEVVVGELAGWTAWREKVGKQAIRGFVRGMIVRERERYKGLGRCLRALREANEQLDGGVNRAVGE